MLPNGSNCNFAHRRIGANNNGNKWVLSHPLSVKCKIVVPERVARTIKEKASVVGSR
jgi:hypothetical protein